MRQRVTATLNISDFNQFKLVSVHEVNGKIIVIADVQRRGGWGHGDLDDYSVSANVKTSSKNDKLEVVYYLTGLSQKDLDNDTYRLATQPTKFMPLLDVSSIQDLLAQGKELHTDRRDNLKAVRVAQQSRTKNGTCTSLNHESPADAVKITATTCENFLNIYALADDGEFKIVLESVQKHDKPDLLQEHLPRGRYHGPVNYELEDSFFQEIDDVIYFTGKVGNETALYKTTAYEFTLPNNNVANCMRFLNFIDALLKKESRHTHVQFGHNSVLAECGELLISKAHMQEKREEVYSLESPTPIALDQFVQKAQPVKDDTRASKLIGQAFIRTADLPDYQRVQQGLSQVTNQANNVATKPIEVLNSAFGEEVSALHDIKRPLAERLQIAKRMEEKMLQDGNLDNFASFLPAAQDAFVAHLIQQAQGKPAHDGGKYKAEYTEFLFLKSAKFHLKPDGRISITHEGNPDYEHYYASGSRNFEIFEGEMRFLGKTTGVDLEFAEDCEFHKEIIFTPACSERLRALGVLLNETALREQLALRQTAAPVTTPAPVKTIDVQPTSLADLLQSNTIQQYFQQFPELAAIIHMLQTAEVFDADMEHNRFLIANLIHACITISKTPVNDKEQQSQDTLANLVELHRVLLANDDHPCLLTAKLHQTIVNSMAKDGQLANTLELIAHAGKLDAALAEKIYLQAAYIDNIRQQVSVFDETFETIMYLVNKVTHPGDLAAIWDMNCMVSSMLFRSPGPRGLSFLTKEDYKYAVDHLENGYSAILGIMRMLSSNTAVVSYRQRIISYAETNNCFREVNATLSDLEYSKSLTPDILDQVLAGVDHKTIYALAKLQNAQIYNEYKDHVLAHPECIEAIEELAAKRILNEVTMRYTLTGASVTTAAAMHHLHQTRLLDECKDYVLAHTDMADMVILLEKLGALTAENFNLARDHQPEFTANVGMLDKLRVLDYWGSYYRTDAERKTILIAVLTNRELCSALTVVREIISSRGVDKIYNDDIVKLLTAAGIAPPASTNAKSNVTSGTSDHPVAVTLGNLVNKGLALFKPKQKTLAEVLGEIKDKYGYQEEVPAHVAVSGLK